ncbi:MAG: hypothetical protein VX278_14140 [Myxococcota bacterium]|nr:hypothetical protein [Myxococcota bacterium]
MNLVSLILLSCSQEVQTETKELSPEEKYIQAVKEGGTLLELKITEGERLANVFTKDDGERGSALFLIYSYEGYYLKQINNRSEKFRSLISIREYQEGEETLFLAHVLDDNDKQKLILVKNGPFEQSNAFNDIDYGTDYGANAQNRSWVGTNDDGMQIVFFESKFFYGPTVKKIYDVEPTPDQVTVQYKINYKKSGVGTNLYDSRPKWQLLDTRWIYTAKKAKETVIVIDHAQKGSFSSISAAQSFGEEKRLVFSGKKGKDTYVVSISGIAAEKEYIENGPYASVTTNRGKIAVHKYSKNPQYVAKETNNVDGKSVSSYKLVFIRTEHNWVSSPSYKEIRLKSDITLHEPVAEAKTDAGTLMLRGTMAGPVVKSISSLQPAFSQEKITYVATYPEGEQVVVINEDVGKKYKEIKALKTTQTTAIPYYIAKTESVVDEKPVRQEHVVLHTKESAKVDSIQTIMTRKNDGIVWLSSVDGQNVVGIDTTVGERFEKISKIYLTERDVLWYTASANEKQHMVVETDKSRPYTQISKPRFTNVSHHILYSGRQKTEAQSEDGLATFKDYIVLNTEDISSFLHSPEDTGGVRKLDGGQSGPELFVVPKSDAYYYKAQSDTNFYVGWDKEKWGPFDQVSSIKLLPDASGIAYITKKEEKDAVQVNGERHKEYDSVRSLGFTKDKKYVRYQAQQEKTQFQIVNKEEYLSVKDEKLNRNQDIFVYQGKKENGWVQVINYQASEASNALSKARFTPDGYGVEVVATTEKGKHLLHKFHERDFTSEETYQDVYDRKRYYLPYGQAPKLMLSDVANVYHLYYIDDEGERRKVEFPELKERSFLATGRSTERIENGWIIEKIEGNQIFIPNGPSERDVEKLNESYRNSVFVLPLYAPYSYGAREKNRGEVFEKRFYKELSNEQFTKNRKLILRSEESGGFRLVFEGSRTGVYGNIGKKYIFHHAENDKDWLVFTAYNAKRTRYADRQFVITNNVAETQNLGYASQISFVKWTDLSNRNEHTIQWEGPGFVAVGDQRYDAVRKVGISPNLEHLNYVASKDGFEFIYHKTKAQPAYKSIRDYSLNGPNDDAAYIGEHVVSRPDNIQQADVVKLDKSIFHVVQGESKSNWYDSIKYFLSGDDINTASFVAKRNGLWNVYRGTEAESPGFDAIEWFHRTEDKKIHYLGRDRDGWHERHDGKETRLVSTILPLPPHNNPEGWQTVNGAYNQALINEKGEFAYLAVNNGDETFYYKNQSYGPEHDIKQFWMFRHGEEEKKEEVFAMLQERKDSTQVLVVDGDESEPFNRIQTEPAFIAATGSLYTHVDQSQIAKKRLDELFEANKDLKRLIEEGDDEELDEYITVKKIQLPHKEALINGVKNVIEANSIVLLEVQESGPICKITDRSAQYIYHSGERGPDFDNYSQAIWGPSLEESRYIYTQEEDGLTASYLGSTEKLLGPFDRGTLTRDNIADQDVFVLVESINHANTLYVNEQKVSSADKILELSDYGSELYIQSRKNNDLIVNLGSKIYDATGFLPASKIERDGTTFELLLRRDRDEFSFQHYDETSEGADMMWDLSAKVSEDQISWSWLDGEIDYETATISITEKALSIAITEDPLADR